MSNVSVVNSKIMTQSDRAGGLVGRMRNGIVENCTSDVTIEAKSRVGGLIGYADSGTIKNCSTSGKVTTVTVYCGGLIRYVGSVTVTDCHSSAEIICVCEGINYARGGGLIGQIEGSSTIERSYATGNVTGGSVSKKGHLAGGLVGVISDDDITVNINECYATGNVSVPNESGNWAHAGGLVGTVNGSAKGTTPPVVNISNCYATGAISVRRYSGGFVGSIYANPGKLNVTNSYSTSDLSGIMVSDRCGVFIGLADKMDAGSAITCKGFVAWDVTGRGFSYKDCVSVDGNYCGTEGTVSQQAKALGWSSDIWDLSGDMPKLKNVK